ncbi:hypothetical protein [Glycomyces buryatensis]|uniref:Uncharacterized protein n=1 Tax=Glycomyces buryatensis TaxID=2570927 RepID=A0A4S8QEG2_9ACTN|nr:hypothetical protein [Glycomyces buryatensis]THV42983.1 hypothetical protein FAB82_03245 [Glycomyces buryatensis]
MSAFDDYLAQLRRVDEARRSAEEAAARTATVTESLGQRVTRLTEQALSQRGAIDELARSARVESPPRGGAVPPLGDPTVEIGAAEADLNAAGAEYQEARFLAHRPPWLPRWRGDERNGLVYGLYAAVALVVQLLILRWFKADSVTEAILLAAVLIASPLAAFGAAWLTIGVGGRPRIFDDERRLERNFRLGLVVSGSTLIVACLGFFS